MDHFWYTRDKETGGQRDRETERQKDRETDRQMLALYMLYKNDLNFYNGIVIHSKSIIIS